jgi:drug/metabolite transporter (DMT)-like permease
MTHRQATMALVVITVIWGLSITAVKAIYGFASPLVAVTVRFGVASLILAPTLRAITREELRAGLRIGAIFSVGVLLQNLGLEITTASRQAFLLSLAAVLTPVTAMVFLRQPSRLDVVIRILAATGGVFLLTSSAGALASVNRGDLLSLGAALLYAGQIVAVGHYAGRVNVARLLAVQFAVTATVAGLTGPFIETPRLDLAPGFFGLLAFLVAASLITFSLQLRAQRVVTASEASLVYTFEPVVTATASWVLLGETLSWGQWAGAVAIMAAVGWPRRSPPTPRAHGAPH